MITIGVDEAGRGPLAGNVIAGAVILPKKFNLPQLTDSKKLTEKKRNTLYELITTQCQWAIGEASVFEIDEINILQATMLAMKRAIENLNVSYDNVLVDGNRCPKVNNCTAIIKGDLIEPVISAASIIAKVSRDKQMSDLDKKYPEYQFAKHKGYGTKLHLELLKKHQPIKGVHRKSFAPIKRLLISS
ncbi:Ribonuclease HII [hydrothermal vent metagenome]|uniref:Ribonuclease HII n=1 Tax=hydrothermal vent metagenome TaxID=652676 RepID=A0A1W1CUR0_9ZZZZ